jgi:hypothetical protein
MTRRVVDAIELTGQIIYQTTGKSEIPSMKDENGRLKSDPSRLPLGQVKYTLKVSQIEKGGAMSSI